MIPVEVLNPDSKAELGPNAHSTACDVADPHPPTFGAHLDSSDIETNPRAVVPRNTVESYRDTHNQDHAVSTICTLGVGE